MRGNKIRVSFASKIFDVLNLIFMLLVIVITFYPILYILSASLSDAVLLNAHDKLLVWPLGGFHLDGYVRAFRNVMLLRSYANTLLYTVLGTLLNVSLTALAAYVLSRKRFYMRGFFTLFITFTMFFSGGMIPTYLTVRAYGLYDNMWAILLPGAMSAWNMIIMRTAFYSIPDSLEESAKLDGASDWLVLTRIILPLSSSTLAVMILFYAVAQWNSWFNAMLYIKSRLKFPLQLILREILIQTGTGTMVSGQDSSEVLALSEVIKYATIIIATIPILMIYPFLQKFFVGGIMVGAIKE